jgi:hypothetical protein
MMASIMNVPNNAVPSLHILFTGAQMIVNKESRLAKSLFYCPKATGGCLHTSKIFILPFQ